MVCSACSSGSMAPRRRPWCAARSRRAIRVTGCWKNSSARCGGGWPVSKSANVSSVSTFVVDRSERGKLALTGAEAKDFLHGQVTNDILGLEPGHGCYAAFLTHKGKMLGDMRVFDLGDELLLDTERATLQELFNMIRRYKLASDVELHKRTLELGLLSLAGPDARRVAGADGLGTEEHANARATIAGTPVVLAATDVG